YAKAIGGVAGLPPTLSFTICGECPTPVQYHLRSLSGPIPGPASWRAAIRAPAAPRIADLLAAPVRAGSDLQDHLPRPGGAWQPPLPVPGPDSVSPFAPGVP